MDSPVDYRKENNIAYITLNRPDEMNSMTPEGFDLLRDMFNQAGKDDDVRVIILTGAGDKAFCSGADLKETIPTLIHGDKNENALEDHFLKNAEMWKPIITAVNGYCLAGGMELLQATDIRIASEHTVFGLPEPKWSIVAGAGSLTRLVRQIPYCRAMEILLTGDTISSEEALQIGLINKVVPAEDLLATAEEYAKKICANGPIAVQATKEAVISLQSLPMDEALQAEWDYASKAFKSEDIKEGIAAFAEKRRPKFEGR